MGQSAVLEQENSLPRAQRQAATAHWDVQRRLRQRALDMGRHVVDAFGRMAVKAVAFRDQCLEEFFHVPQNPVVGIFLYRQRRRGMPDKNTQQAGGDLLLAQPAGNVGGNFGEPLAGGFVCERSLRLFQWTNALQP